MIYLDNAATTKVYDEVAKVMRECFLLDYGNPNSTHLFGERARELMNSARKALAKEINARDFEIVFTSGASESNNLAIQGLASKTKKKN